MNSSWQVESLPKTVDPKAFLTGKEPFTASFLRLCSKTKRIILLVIAFAAGGTFSVLRVDQEWKISHFRVQH